MRTTKLFYTSLDAYREKLFQEIYSKGGKLEIYCGDNYFTKSFITRIKVQYNRLENIFILKRKFLYQKGTLSASKGCRLIILEMNPRIISNWMIILLSKIRKQKVILWGHFYGRDANSSDISRSREFMCRLAKGGVICYTEIEANLFSKKFPSLSVHVAANAIYNKQSIVPIDHNDSSIDFAYCGRLDVDKQVVDLIQTFSEFKSQKIRKSRLHIIGDGPIEAELKSLVEQLNLTEEVIFHGYISSEIEIRRILQSCCAQITCGFVGLNAIQSLGFGLPMIFPKHPNLRHAPERYILDSSNSIEVQGGFLEYSAAMESILKNRKSWISRKEKISDLVANTHSIEIMAETFVALILANGFDS